VFVVLAAEAGSEALVSWSIGYDAASSLADCSLARYTVGPSLPHSRALPFGSPASAGLSAPALIPWGGFAHWGPFPAPGRLNVRGLASVAAEANGVGAAVPIDFYWFTATQLAAFAEGACQYTWSTLHTQLNTVTYQGASRR
jgi:hypothetical protein